MAVGVVMQVVGRGGISLTMKTVAAPVKGCTHERSEKRHREASVAGLTRYCTTSHVFQSHSLSVSVSISRKSTRTPRSRILVAWRPGSIPAATSSSSTPSLSFSSEAISCLSVMGLSSVPYLHGAGAPCSVFAPVQYWM